MRATILHGNLEIRQFFSPISCAYQASYQKSDLTTSEQEDNNDLIKVL